MHSFFKVALLSLLIAHGVSDGRNIRGKVYYSNNTPDDRATFPVELWTTNQKRQVAKTTLGDSAEFFLPNIPPGRYLLKIIRPEHCTLIYRVDLRKQSLTNIRIVMDAECDHTNGKISDLPKN